MTNEELKWIWEKGLFLTREIIAKFNLEGDYGLSEHIISFLASTVEEVQKKKEV